MNIDLNGCIRGRKGAWDAFVQQTVRIVYAAVQRTIRQWPHDPQDVDDRVQDVYLKLLQDDCRLLKQFDPQRASLSTWLTLVARSTTRDSMTRRRVPTVPLAAHDGTLNSHSTANEPAIDMSVLTERQRLVLQMLFDENMTVEEAASRLEVDPQTIRSTKHKALTRLRETLGLET